MEGSGNDSVAIGIPDRNILERKTAEANEGHRSPSTKWAPLTKEIITILEEKEKVVKPPEPAFFSMWDHNIFTTVYVIAVLIDPLFLYIPLVDNNLKCVDSDKNLLVAYRTLRLTTDLFYFMDFLFSIPENSKKLRAMMQQKNYQVLRRWKEKIPSPKLLLQFGLCFGLFFVTLPIPLVMICISVQSNFLLTLFAIQYAERVCLIYMKLKQCTNIETGIGRWFKAILDFFPFILVAHEAKRLSKEHKLSRKMQMINPEIDLWLSKNGLPNDKDIKKWIRKSVRQKLEEDKDFVVQNLNIFSVLPIMHRRYIMSFLRLASLKKVPMLEKMNEQVLEAICNHLEPMTYQKNSYIIRDGEPLWSMLFITQGTALTYKISSDSNFNMGASTSDSSIIDCLRKGDFYGEELLNWAFTFASFSKLPISTRTIISQTKLEAFSINASDLESVVSKFWFYFSLMDRPHLERSHLAAKFLQSAWCARLNRRTPRD